MFNYSLGKGNISEESSDHFRTCRSISEVYFQYAGLRKNAKYLPNIIKTRDADTFLIYR
jgi:hypothetical protein